MEAQVEDYNLVYLNLAIKEFVDRIWIAEIGYTLFRTLEDPNCKEYHYTCKIIKNEDTRNQVLSELYDRGRAVGFLPWHFDTFKKWIYNAISGGENWFPKVSTYIGWKSPSRPKKTKWEAWYYHRNEKSTKYVRRDHHKKKVIDEKGQHKKDWRDQKGFAKDQSKNRTWCKCRRYHKQVGNRKNRRHDKQLIHHGRYDEIYYNQDMWISMWDVC